MKIKIGNYKSWLGPYQLAEIICFWVKSTPDENGFPSKPDWIDEFGERLSNIKWLVALLQWINSKKKRKVSIKIDKWDTWGMDHTLSMIILPMLKQLHKSKHGAPFVDDEDVPEELRSTVKPPEDEYDVDGNHFNRWNWIMDEMIWTFTQLADDNNEDQFHSGHIEFDHIPVEGSNTIQMVKGKNDTHVFDKENFMKHQERISNGMRLFGKYYRGLWD